MKCRAPINSLRVCQSSVVRCSPGLQISTQQSDVSNGSNKLFFRCNDKDSTTTLGMSICWAIWKARNAKVFENKGVSIQGVLATTSHWYNLYFNFIEAEEALEVNTNQENPTTEANNIWRAPDYPKVKINVDAAWKDGAYACAALARDSNGNWCGVGTKAGRSNSVVSAEAEGFKLATELAVWLNLGNVIIEDDSQVVVNSLKGVLRKIPWRIWRLKDDIISRMSTLNGSGAYKYVPKPANSAAHSLAAYALSNNVHVCGLALISLLALSASGM